MAFRISPGIDVTETDLTLGVEALNTTRGAFAGVFRWGPLDQFVLVDGEKSQVKNFGKPSNFNGETWFVLNSFLSYGSPCYVSRAGNTAGLTPTMDVTVTANTRNVTVSNTADLREGMLILTAEDGRISTNTYIHSIVNSTVFELSSNSHALSSGNDYIQFITNTVFSAVANTGPVANLEYSTVKNESDFNQKFGTFDTDVKFIARYPGEDGSSLRVSVCGSADGYQSTINLSSSNTTGTFYVNVNSNVATITVTGVNSYTNVTFNSNTSVNATAKFITVANNTFANDDIVTYIVSAGNTALTGLVNGESYFVVSANSTGVKLANTVGGSAIDLTAGVTESGHTLSRIDQSGSQVANVVLTNIATNLFSVGDLVKVGNNDIGIQYMKITSIGSPVEETLLDTTLTLHFEDKFKLATSYLSNNSIERNWEFFNKVDRAPGQSEWNLTFGNTSINNDELHVVVVDEGGKFTGTPGTILEIFREVSRGTDAKNIDGELNYWKTVINDSSQYIYVANDLSGLTSNTAENLVSSTLNAESYQLAYGRNGEDEINVPVGLLAKAYDLFRDTEKVDFGLIMTGKTNSFVLPNYITDNIAEERKDCINFISPPKPYVVNNIGNEAAAMVEFRSILRASSYAVMDSGYKYMYDKFNDVYRWVPLNGDTAGLCARTESTNDAWWSPGGFNRGQLKNVVKLAYNPSKADRDILYPADINPVVTFPGQGTILYGDKTMLGKNSAFSRINVRRLFIVVEKAIATASQYLLFEFNDEYTRASFRNLVNPYLRTIKGKRGITDFYVVCNATNNPASVIDANEFVGDIYIKPARSINFIRLNFYSVPTGANFSEIIVQQ